VDLRAQTTSTVAQVLVKDGQFVKKGELLFRFDDRADRAALDKARAQLARDRASLADLERQLTRAKELLAQNFIAQNAVDTRRPTSTPARPWCAATRPPCRPRRSPGLQRAARAHQRPRRHRQRLPGQPGAGQCDAAPLVNIAQIDPIGISFTLPETSSARCWRHARRRAGRRGAAAAGLAARRGVHQGPRDRRGQPRRRGHRHHQGQGRVRQQGPGLWPGQYLRVRVTLRTLKGVTVVPQAAIIMRGNERSVYVVGPDNTAKLVPVQLRQAG
jgi:multidrug efflux pump subunit AcrA (membrane-fusion protein)